MRSLVSISQFYHDRLLTINTKNGSQIFTKYLSVRLTKTLTGNQSPRNSLLNNNSISRQQYLISLFGFNFADFTNLNCVLCIGNVRACLPACLGWCVSVCVCVCVCACVCFTFWYGSRCSPHLGRRSPDHSHREEKINFAKWTLTCFNLCKSLRSKS